MSEAIASPLCVEVDLDGPTAMQRDLNLLAAGVPAVRVYTWEGVWVTIGRNQDPDQALVDARNTRWVRRPTGGAAVLHGHDVTIGLVMPLSLRSAEDTYRTATAPLIAALRALGISADLGIDVGRETSSPAFADCFATSTRNDIVDPRTMQKICGCALKRTRSAVLLQASVPVAEPLVDPATLLSGGVKAATTIIQATKLAEHLNICM